MTEKWRNIFYLSAEKVSKFTILHKYDPIIMLISQILSVKFSITRRKFGSLASGENAPHDKHKTWRTPTTKHIAQGDQGTIFR